MNVEGGLFHEDMSKMEVQESDFEPFPRERSNTWHGDFVCFDNRTHSFSAIPEKVSSSEENGVVKLESDSKLDAEVGDDGLHGTVVTLDSGSAKKGSMRRNAWGNASYAELIAQAIESSPEKRLTLTQIYDWMVKNIPYFQLRSDGSSSMGWKNSIRHNLSLHNQFSRVQNEGAGKSSWWIVNRNFVKSKLPRRRATMGDPAILDRKRCRVNKKLKSQDGDASSAQDESNNSASRKIRTISEANEAMLDIDPKSPATTRRFSNQMIDDSNDQSKCLMSLGSKEKPTIPASKERKLKWQSSEERVHDQMSSMAIPPTTLSYVVCSSVSLTLQQPQLGFSMSRVTNQANHNSIILKVQPSNVQSNYFESNKLPSPILLYVTPSDKCNVLQTPMDQMEQSDTSLGSIISRNTMSELNKQTNQMSLTDNYSESFLKMQLHQSEFNISEKRQKMLMELLHSERFCQLRRQNPELNRKIIEMLERKKNMLSMKKSLNNSRPSQLSSSESDIESHMELQSPLQSPQTTVPENRSAELLSFKLDSCSEEIRSSILSPNNISGNVLEKPDTFTDSFDFSQSNSFQVDVDQVIGDIDFDGNIDDLFSDNGLQLFSCEDELSTHEFSS